MALKPPAKPVVDPKERLQGHLRWVQSTTQGRAAMWWVLDSLGYLNGQAFAGEATHQTAFNEGRRQVALELMLELQRADPRAYRLMLEERLKADDVQAQLLKKPA